VVAVQTRQEGLARHSRDLGPAAPARADAPPGFADPGRLTRFAFSQQGTTSTAFECHAAVNPGPVADALRYNARMVAPTSEEETMTA
jgi:hypothetical protein